jgi:hypothetical protein
MKQYSIWLAAMALAGILIFSSGESPWGKGSCSGSQGLTAAVQSLVQEADVFLSPASAEAAVVKKSTKKPASHPRAATHKKRAKTAAHNKSKAKVSKVKNPKTRVTAAKNKKSPTKVKHSGLGRTKTRHNKISGTRCEPQSLTYARQRSGVMRSRTGRENGPLTWFASEKKLGKTSDKPAPGSILILAANKRHGMSTGHVAYVENAHPTGPSTYKITFSHTNYDRRCSLETNVDAVYNSSTLTLDIFSGAWRPWGSGLRVAGFIQQ